LTKNFHFWYYEYIFNIKKGGETKCQHKMVQVLLEWGQKLVGASALAVLVLVGDVVLAQEEAWADILVHGFGPKPRMIRKKPLPSIEKLSKKNLKTLKKKKIILARTNKSNPLPCLANGRQGGGRPELF
jgi:hypothetical protein